MDRRSWPWKKKSSEKIVSADSAAFSSASSVGNKVSEIKESDNVTISKDQHAHFLRLEDEVRTLENQCSSQSEKLSTAQSDLVAKENLVKQHAKVAEEAVSGWEKAEAEALTLKTQLESVMLQKLTAEDRAAHLDGALKECMKQIRLIKEESEQQLQDVIFAKTQQWENLRFELDSRIDDLEQELLRSTAENDALSRSLQERSTMLMKISEEKNQADAEIEVLKTTIQSYEKEIGSLKYEVHIVTKELEIRNEEKNMSVKSADVANKQHLEDVKKIAKLDAECQRLRKLVRKRLPGPAALAQMRQEVDSFGRHPPPKGTRENVQQYQKEKEFLTARLLAMEEETKMLKEALAKRNSELQTSRNICAKTSSKLRSLETHMLVINRQSPSKLSPDIDGTMSTTSLSEDGIDEQESFGESWSTAVVSEPVKEEKVDKSHDLELLDDFLEMERLACLSSSEAKEEDEGNKASGESSEESETAISELQARIATMVKERSKNMDMGKLLEDIKAILLDAQEEIPQTFVDCTADAAESSNASPDDQSLRTAIAQIHSFVLSSSKEVTDEDHGLSRKLEELAECMEKVVCCVTSCDSLILNLAEVLNKIDECGGKSKTEELRRERDEVLEEVDRARSRLSVMEEEMERMKTQLGASEKSVGLAETQLKCMTESYKSMEERTRELETEVERLRVEVERLEEDLRQERSRREEELTRCKDLEEQIERNRKGSTSDAVSDADAETKTKQEEIALAAEKLAECQETILQLSRQLQTLHPSPEVGPSPPSHSPTQTAPNSLDSRLDRPTGPTRRSADRYSGEFPFNAPPDPESSSIPRSPIAPRRPIPRSPGPSPPSPGSSSTPEKHGRSFTRFFSKTKRDSDGLPSYY
ncbi:filament-like plant protein 4 [Wolffia australiana]